MLGRFGFKSYFLVNCSRLFLPSVSLSLFLLIVFLSSWKLSFGNKKGNHFLWALALMVAGDGGQLVHFVTFSLSSLSLLSLFSFSLTGLFVAVKTAFEVYLLPFRYCVICYRHSFIRQCLPTRTRYSQTVGHLKEGGMQTEAQVGMNEFADNKLTKVRQYTVKIPEFALYVWNA